jgi:hypothetical protein
MDKAIDSKIKGHHQSVTEKFKAFKAEREAAQKLQLELKAGIDALSRERSQLMASPVCQADFIAMLKLHIGRAAERSRKNMSDCVLRHLRGQVRTNEMGVFPQDELNFSAFQRFVADGSNYDRHTALILGLHPNSGHVDGDVKFDSLCAMFEDAMKAQVEKNISLIDWPYKDAKPAPERLARLDAIEVELTALQERSEQLLGLLQSVN